MAVQLVHSTGSEVTRLLYHWTHNKCYRTVCTGSRVFRVLCALLLFYDGSIFFRGNSLAFLSAFYRRRNGAQIQ